MLGKVSTHLKGNLLEKMDKNEMEALMGEFENWSNGQNPLLRKMGFMQMATNMNENEIQNLRQMFIKIDGDKNGQISATELHEFMKKLKIVDSNSQDNTNTSLNNLQMVQDIIQETD